MQGIQDIWHWQCYRERGVCTDKLPWWFPHQEDNLPEISLGPLVHHLMQSSSGIMGQ